jgi:hypothetical protein
MKKQNTEMKAVLAIPIFGMTLAAADFKILTADGHLRPPTVGSFITQASSK